MSNDVSPVKYSGSDSEILSFKTPFEKGLLY